MVGLDRQNQELEQYSASMLEDKLRLQEQADSLSQRLEAVLHDKFQRKSFDSDTPIDKTLAYLQSVIQVCCALTLQWLTHSMGHKRYLRHASELLATGRFCAQLVASTYMSD